MLLLIQNIARHIVKFQGYIMKDRGLEEADTMQSAINLVGV